MIWTKGYWTSGEDAPRVHFRATEPPGARDAARPALVLFHQTASASVMFEALMAHLARDFFVVAPDTPGFGESDPLPADRPVTIAAYAAVLHAALRSAGVGPAFLFGHHTGASIAAEIAAAYPEATRALALSGPPSLTPDEQATFAAKLEPFAIREDGGHLVAAWTRVRKKDPRAPLSLVHRETVLTLGAGPHHRQAYDAVWSHDLVGRLRQIRCRTLVMAGDADLLFPYMDSAYRCLAHGEKVIIPEAGTYLCERNAAEVAAVLARFFREDER